MSKVLLVDDDQSMIGLLTTLLELGGFNIVSESKSAAVIPSIKAENPDVVLMDINLKDGNGLDILRQIRADNAIKGLPVVMSSGLDLKHECMQAGANNFIQKPYSPSDLINMIKAFDAG